MKLLNRSTFSEIITLLSINFAVITCVASVSKHTSILVVSYDGFRYDYFNRNITPHMEGLRRSGSHAEYMKNVFETKTFPNHHSIATGLYPEVHGVLANQVFDPEYKQVLKYGNEFWHYNEEAVPIWTLNEAAGEGRHSGVMMWPGGGDIVYLNTTLTFNQTYDPKVSLPKRIDTVIEWFTNKTSPANLVFLYYQEPDETAHLYGPESEEVSNKLKELDNATAYLLSKLKEKNLTDSVNVFFLSDHGFETVTPARILNVTDLIPEDVNCTFVGSSPVLQVYPEKGHEDIVYDALKNASEQMGHFKVYKKSEVPERWHFKNNRRVPPILLVADEAYAFDDMYKWTDAYANKTGSEVNENTTFGLHGYDNAEKNMHPFFFAFGPQIKKNFQIDPFDSVDLYSLFTHMLKLKSLPTNGSLENVRTLLISEPEPPVPIIIILMVAAALVLTASAIVFICLVRHRKKGRNDFGAPYSAIDDLEGPRMGRQNRNREVQHLLDEDTDE